MSNLTGTTVTIVYSDETEEVVVTGARLEEVRKRLNTALGQPEIPAFLEIQAVDRAEDMTIFVNLSHVACFRIEPVVLADPEAPPATTDASNSSPKARAGNRRKP